MSFPNNRVILREAGPKDDQRLLEILEDNDFKGDICLLYTRRPSPWRSFQREGERVALMVAEKTATKKTIALAGCALNTLYINGRAEAAGYLMGLRIKRGHLSSVINLPSGYAYLFDKFHNIPVFITTILESNQLARRLLEKKRRNMPVYDYIGDYEVYAVKTGGRGAQFPGYSFSRAEEQDLKSLNAFLNCEGRRFQFFPKLTEEQLIKGEQTPHYRDFYLLRDSRGRVVAAGAVWDQQSYKQYLVMGYKGSYRLLYRLRGLLALAGFPLLAKPGHILNCASLSFFAVRGNDTRLFELLVDNVRMQAKHYSYLLAGFHQANPLKSVFRKRPHVLYKSRIYLVYKEQSGSERARIMGSGRPIYLENGRL